MGGRRSEEVPLYGRRLGDALKPRPQRIQVLHSFAVQPRFRPAGTAGGKLGLPGHKGCPAPLQGSQQPGRGYRGRFKATKRPRQRPALPRAGVARYTRTAPGSRRALWSRWGGHLFLSRMA